MADPVARAAHVRMRWVGESRLAIRTPSRFLTLDGDEARAVHEIWMAIDQPRALKEVARRTRVAYEDVTRIVTELIENKLVVPVSSAGDREASPVSILDEFLDLPSTAPGDVRVAVVGESTLAEEVSRQCRAFGLQCGPAIDVADADVNVAVARSEDVSALDVATRLSHERGKPLVVGEWRGLTAVLGPTTGSPGAACWGCAEHRVVANAEDPEALQVDRTPQEPPAEPVPPAHAALVAGWVAQEVVRVALTGSGSMRNRQLVLNLWDLRAEESPTLPVPGCDFCAGGMTRPEPALSPPNPFAASRENP